MTRHIVIQHDSFMCVPWLIHVCHICGDMTDRCMTYRHTTTRHVTAYVTHMRWHDETHMRYQAESYIWCMNHIESYEWMYESYEWMHDVTHMRYQVWHDSSIAVTWLVCAVLHSYVWHEWRDTYAVSGCNGLQGGDTYDMTHSYVWRDTYAVYAWYHVCRSLLRKETYKVMNCLTYAVSGCNGLQGGDDTIRMNCMNQKSLL